MDGDEKRTDLAGERTNLARERTFLSYVRTAISLIVLGAVLIHFFEVGAFVVAGLIAIVLGITALIFSIVRFRNLYDKIRLF